MIENKKIKVLVFGTFDGVHDGHRHFLREAKKLGEELVISVARDSTVKLLKNHMPSIPLPNRVRLLRKENIADKIVFGDKKIGDWKILKNEKPDVVAIGFDQYMIKKSLEENRSNFDWKLSIVTISEIQVDKQKTKITEI